LNSFTENMKFKLCSTSDTTLIWDEEILEFVDDGTSPYLIELDNDSATIGTNASGDYDS
jgi:hypothetical protein